MDLMNYKWLLIDEFPDNKEVKLCIFTRPKYPIQNQQHWHKDLKFLCANTAFVVFKTLQMNNGLRNAKILAMKDVQLLGQDLKVQRFDVDEFKSTMLLFYRKDNPNEGCLYPGQFTSWRYALMHGLFDHLHRISDIFVDSTLTNIEHPNSLTTACEVICEIVRKNPNHQIILSLSELFGYEDLLIKLAREFGMKVKLHPLQLVQFRLLKNIEELFEFDGKADIIVSMAHNKSDMDTYAYQELFEKNRTISIKLIPTKYELKIDHGAQKTTRTSKKTTMEIDKWKHIANSEKPKGVVYVSYSPHPTRTTLNGLLNLIKPQRIHQIIKLDVSDDQSILIPNELVPAGCEVITYENKKSVSFEFSFEEVWGMIYEGKNAPVNSLPRTMSPLHESTATKRRRKNVGDRNKDKSRDEEVISLSSTHTVKFKRRKLTNPTNEMAQIENQVGHFIYVDSASDESEAPTEIGANEKSNPRVSKKKRKNTNHKIYPFGRRRNLEYLSSSVEEEEVEEEAEEEATTHKKTNNQTNSMNYGMDSQNIDPNSRSLTSRTLRLENKTKRGRNETSNSSDSSFSLSDGAYRPDYENMSE